MSLSTTAGQTKITNENIFKTSIREEWRKDEKGKKKKKKKENERSCIYVSSMGTM